MQEHRTAGIVAQHLRDAGYEVTEGGLLMPYSYTTVTGTNN